VRTEKLKSHLVILKRLFQAAATTVDRSVLVNPGEMTVAKSEQSGNCYKLKHISGEISWMLITKMDTGKFCGATWHCRFPAKPQWELSRVVLKGY
jgi:hypothetical protein